MSAGGAASNAPASSVDAPWQRWINGIGERTLIIQHFILRHLRGLACYVRYDPLRCHLQRVKPIVPPAATDTGTP